MFVCVIPQPISGVEFAGVRKTTLMKKTIHYAATRGYANHGWLQSFHTFSFADYYNPQRIHFGALRVLNDDTIAGGQGFGTHPHDNMEIVTIPLGGVLEHKDSMGNTEQLRPGEIQVMSAGRGITHSEYNADPEVEAKILQIWVLSDARGHTPRYDTVTLSPQHRNSLRLIVAPEGMGSQHVGWIHQRAWFYTASLESGHSIEYKLNMKGHGVYLFVIEGRVSVDGSVLQRRDGIGIWETDSFYICAEADAELLLIEVPM